MGEIVRSILFLGAITIGVLWWVYGVPLYGIIHPFSLGLLDMVVLWIILYSIGLLPRWLTGEKDDP